MGNDAPHPHRFSGVIGADRVDDAALARYSAARSALRWFHRDRAAHPANQQAAPGRIDRDRLRRHAVAILRWSESDLPLIGSLPRSFPSFAIPQRCASLTGANSLVVRWPWPFWAASNPSPSQRPSPFTPASALIQIRNSSPRASRTRSRHSSSAFPVGSALCALALDYAAGAATRFAAVFNGLFVAAIFYLFAGQARSFRCPPRGRPLRHRVRPDRLRLLRAAVRTSRNDALVAFATARPCSSCRWNTRSSSASFSTSAFTFERRATPHR